MAEKNSRQSTELVHEEPFTVFEGRQKLAVISFVSIAAFFSPLSSNIYYAAVAPLAHDLNESITNINFSFTSYMIVQGIAPVFVAEITESVGRRPTYLICFIIYIAANIGLALQKNLAALIVLRCLQAAGSSGTVVLANAVIADVVTTAERGRYMGYTFAGAFIGQSLGPVVGGILGQFLGWPAIFWFLTILSIVFFVLLVIFLPETSRKLVQNGSRQSHGMNMSVLDLCKRQARNRLPEAEGMLERARFSFPNPLASLRVFLNKEAAVILLYSGFLFAGLALITVAIPSEFEARYHYNALEIGLSFLPGGVGSCIAAFVGGTLVDRNYARHARRLNMPVEKKKQQAIGKFPIERARIEIAIPFTMFGVLCTIGYGWSLQYSPSVAAPFIFMFWTCFATTGAFNVMNTLLIDIYTASPARASACSNLIRCVLGAGSSAASVPLFHAIKPGWVCTLVALVWIGFQPLAIFIAIYAPRWRKAVENSTHDDTVAGQPQQPETCNTSSEDRHTEPQS